MKTIFLLLVSLTVGLAAPRRGFNTYDQRQDGEFNFHGKFDNFLLIFAPSSASSLSLAELADNPLVTGALDFKNVNARISPIQEEAQRPDHHQDEASPLPEAETTITRIAAHEPSKIEDDKSSAKIAAIGKDDHAVESKNEDIEKHQAKSQVRSKTARSVKNRSPDPERESKLPPKSSGLEPLENKVAGKDRGNDVGSSEKELKLIGGGIENCGPGRFRDRSGICQLQVES